MTACTTARTVVVPAGVKESTSITQNTDITSRFDSISRDHVRFVWLTPGERHDTLHILDSIYIDRWRVRTDSILRTDSIVRIDTIVTTVEIEKPYKAFLVKSGIALWIIVSLILLAVVAGIFIKFAK